MAREYSYVNCMQLDKYPVIFFLKEQRQRFKDVLEMTCRNLKNKYAYLDIYSNFVSFGSEFNTMRYPDFTEHPYNRLTLLHNLIPSIQSKVSKTNHEKLFQNTKRSTKFLMCQHGPDKLKNIEKLSKLRLRNSGVDINKMKKVIKDRNINYDSYQDFDSFFLPNI